MRSEDDEKRKRQERDDEDFARALARELNAADSPNFTSNTPQITQSASFYQNSTPNDDFEAVQEDLEAYLDQYQLQDEG